MAERAAAGKLSWLDFGWLDLARDRGSASWADLEAGLLGDPLGPRARRRNRVSVAQSRISSINRFFSSRTRHTLLGATFRTGLPRSPVNLLFLVTTCMYSQAGAGHLNEWAMGMT